MIKLVNLLKEVEDFDLSDNPLVSCRYKVFYFEYFDGKIEELKASKDIKDYDKFYAEGMQVLNDAADGDNDAYELDPEGYDFDDPHAGVELSLGEGVVTAFFVSDWESLSHGILVVDKRASEIFNDICRMYEEGGNDSLIDYVYDLIFQ